MTGSGTLLDPFVIYDVNDLQAMENDLDAYYELANDIDASETVTWNAGAGFLPIGQADDFCGELDGKGHAISNLYISRVANSQGLFSWPGVEGYTAVIKNLYLRDFSIRGRRYVGSLAGGVNERWLIQNVHAIDPVITESGTGIAGGLVGRVEGGGLLEDCDVTGLTLTTISGGDDGGLIGDLVVESDTITRRCYATGTIIDSGTGASYMAGLIGYCGTNSSATSAISLSIEDCYAEVDITGDEDSDFVAGFAGQIDADDYSTILVSGCYSKGRITGGSYLGGFACLIEGVALHVGNPNGILVIEDCYAEVDIDHYSGHIVGGFFGYNVIEDEASDVTVRDCYATGDITNIGTSGGDDLGGFCGNINCRIQRCYSTGNIYDDQATSNYIGGFVGHPIGPGEVSECFSTGNVTGYERAGGFCGVNDDGIIEDCYSRGDVTALSNVDIYAGGFVGEPYGWDGYIKNCYSTGLVTIPSGADPTYVGGFSGDNWEGDFVFTACFWDTQTSGYLTSNGGTGKTTTEMKTTATFTDAGWNFTTIWDKFSYCNDGYPCLQAVTPNCAARAGGYKGNILIDQLIFQHCERIRR